MLLLAISTINLLSGLAGLAFLAIGFVWWRRNVAFRADSSAGERNALAGDDTPTGA
ncbi:MAG: hypothetical protein ACI8TP_002811 [Acidimicrobiales bacterium]|jgi:hypothetical protein